MKFAVFAFSVGVAMATTVLPMTPTHAQMGGGHHRRGDGSDQKAPKTPKVDEKAYNAALQTIPDSKEKFDPWGSLGVSSAAKKPK
jgi:hypothetical protein